MNELNVQKENLDSKNKEIEKNLDEETKKVSGIGIVICFILLKLFCLCVYSYDRLNGLML